MSDEKKESESSIKQLNDSLLAPDKPKGDDAKRNTKEWLIDRILSVADENGLELTYSNTKLKRMSKKELNQLLGQLMEQVVKQNMARAVGSTDTDDRSIALGTLRMCHDMMAMAAENGLNTVLPGYGYQVSGFTESLQHPTVSKCVDECLSEIAATTDILEYIESPYARLGIAWAGALATSIKPYRKIEYKQNVGATNLGPQPANRAQALQHRPGRRPQAGKVNRPARPDPQNVKRV